ncbi:MULTISPECIES: ribosome biogenesis GTPase Der [Aminobacterium]|jgi:GTP-binding protein|uniref:ribosome biogenesis GTPase Der n=1 Tax=Aminobacterium TaxID=81466 RepID=UPI000464EFD7|nr:MULTISPECIES: ribosome biogenesis GTPase Der [Aminobacterium]
MPIVAIVGRPNVGKSSLFNRILGRREAIVDDMPGVTRDRIYGEVEWKGKNFYIVDTGGLLIRDDHPLVDGIRKQVTLAIQESQVILFVIDGMEGPTWMDEDVAQILRQSGKPVVVVANKLDDGVHEDRVYDAYTFGFEHVIGISALHKRYIDDLLDMVASFLPAEEKEIVNPDEIRVSIVGRPNVGKSSIINALAGGERVLVSDIPGTTRDATDTVIETEKGDFRLIDTAGLRKKSRFDSDLEYYSFVRTLQAVDRSDVALLIMDASEPATDQDKKMAAQVIEKGKGIILVVNKWDTLKVSPKLGDEMKKKIYEEMPFLTYAPILFVSALTKRGLHKLLEAVVTVHGNRKRRIGTTELNRLMRDVLAFQSLPTNKRGRALKIYYCTQIEIEPPTFVFFVNDPEIVPLSFKRHIENKIREMSTFDGSPLRLFWRIRQ